MVARTGPISHGATTVGTEATPLDDSTAPLNNGVLIVASESNFGTVYVGSSADVTAADGFPIGPGKSLEIEAPAPSHVFLIATAADQAVRWIGT